MYLKYITDKKRHLICVPYSIKNIHQMAQELGIDKCWFRKNHYDIPKKRITEIEKKCQIVDPTQIVEIIRSPEYAETILSEPVSSFGAKSKGPGFLMTQMKYKGNV